MTFPERPANDYGQWLDEYGQPACVHCRNKREETGRNDFYMKYHRGYAMEEQLNHCPFCRIIIDGTADGIQPFSGQEIGFPVSTPDMPAPPEPIESKS